MKFINNEKGFTLIDIIVALIIILLFMSLISVLFFNITKSSKSIERESHATFIATNIIEAYKSLNYDDVLPIAENHEITDGTEIVPGQPIVIQDGYSAFVTIQNYVPEGEDSNNDLVKKIIVTVKYKVANKEKSVQLESSVTRK